MVDDLPYCIGIPMTVEDFIPNVGFLGKPKFMFDLLSKESVYIPMKFIICFNGTLVPSVPSSHELADFRSNKWARSRLYLNAFYWGMSV